MIFFTIFININSINFCILKIFQTPFGSKARPVSHKNSFGFFAALVFLLHPLQTEAVTYVSQRAESLMGLFYLLTLYGFIRSVTAESRNCWLILSVAACLCGMATKQVMVTAPVLVLLYDRAFVSGSFRSALAKRRWYYAGLAATWLWLGFLMHRSSQAR